MKLKQKLAIGVIRARLNLLFLVSPQKAAKKAFALFCTPTQRSGSQRTPLMEKGIALSFALDGHLIRGHRWLPAGIPAPARKALIIHGWESSSGNFGQYVEALVKKGYEVLAFDGRAHGLSGGKRITLPSYIQMIRTVHELYGPIQSYMAHSFGGLALTLFLESAPPPPDSDTRVVLIAPMCETITAVDNFFQLLGLNPEMRSAFDQYEYELFGKPFSWYSIRRAMHHLQVETLWIQDEDDRITPLKDALEVQADRHPHIRFIFTKGLGHRKIYREEETVKTVAEFL